MPIQITMPALSPTMEEGNLAKWLVKEGDSVSAGDVIAEIETDKATMEVEAVDEGTVAKIVVAEGTQGVKVNSVIAILAAEGEDVKEAAAGGAESAAPAPKVEAEAAPKQEQAPAQEAAPQPKPEPVNAGNGERVFASPLARRIAGEAGIRLSAVSGSGPHGRIVKADVKAAISGGTAVKAATAVGSPIQAMSDETVLKLFEDGSYELIPHDTMRRTIARRLVEAKSTVPHFYLTLDCEIDELLEMRKRINDAAPMMKTDNGKEPTYKLSVNDFVIKAYAMALREIPDANVSWTESAMVKHSHADVGVAVSIPGGLITPIVRHAEGKPLSVISNEMKDLASRARSRKLKPEEYQGGSGAVSNLGMYGIKDFAAVINPPHATILAVGAGEQRAVVRNGEIVVANVMSVTLSTDHRAVDGALGAELLSAFKRYIEQPLAMLV